MNITPCLSHVSLGSNDFEAAAAFYDRALAALGCRRVLEHPGAIGYGRDYPEFWLQVPIDGLPASPATARTSAFSRPASNRWMNSIGRRCWPAPSMKARPVRGRTTVRLTTAALFGIWMGTRLKPASGMKARPEEVGKPNKKMPVIKPALYESNVLCSNSKIRK